jgi:hypothetical protein
MHVDGACANFGTCDGYGRHRLTATDRDQTWPQLDGH